MKRSLISLLTVLFLLTALGISPTPPAHADTFDVPCEVEPLLQAISDANANINGDGDGEADVINLAHNCTYTLSQAVDFTDGANGLPPINSPITINGGPGVVITRGDTEEPFRILHVGPEGRLTLNQVTVSGGLIRGLAGADGVISGESGQPGGEGLGGGIYNRGVLTLTHSIVRDNQAVGGGGGDGVTNTSPGATGSDGDPAQPNGGDGGPGGDGGRGGSGGHGLGGGIYNASTLTIVASTILSNSTTGGDGGRGGDGAKGGNGGSGYDGGPDEDGGNGGNGGPGGSGGGSGNGGRGLGGGIYNAVEATVAITGATLISGNVAQGGSGSGSGLGNDGGRGGDGGNAQAGGLGGEGGDGGRGGDGGDSFGGWGGDGHGGGLYNAGGLTLLSATGSATFHGNTASGGAGGGYASPAASGGTGGLGGEGDTGDGTDGDPGQPGYTEPGRGGAGSGGGLYNGNISALTNAAIENNQVHGGSGEWYDGESYGGGIYNAQALTLSHTTLTGNGAETQGGGLYTSETLTGTLRYGSTGIVSHSSFTANLQGGLYALGLMTVTHTTFQENEGYGLRLHADDWHRASDLTLTDNPALIGGGTSYTQTAFPAAWNADYYLLEDDVTIAAGATWSAEPGVEFRGAPHAQLIVQGELEASGTLSEPIIFSSAANTATTQWQGIRLDGGSGVLYQARVRYAEQGVQIEGGSAALICTLVTGSQYNGVRISGASADLEVRHSAFVDNGAAGITNTTGITVDARYNWWGDSSGPGGFGPGFGDEVGPNVTFDPWLTHLPECLGGRPTCTPLETVVVTGPLTTPVNSTAVFTAQVNPLLGTATPPISYTWEATAYSLTHRSGGLNDVITLTWGITGPKTVAVTATNPCGISVHDLLTLTVQAKMMTERVIYLPVVLRGGGAPNWISD